MFEINNLNYSIDHKIILENISFKFKAGERISLIGPNGAGKTSLLNCLSLINTYEGEILFHGQSLLEINKKEYFKKTAFSFQNFNNFSAIRVCDFIKYSFYPFETKISKMEIEDKYQSIVNSLDIEKISLQKLNTLSGGELQKIKLAACLVKEPSVLFLDEIFNHLDPKVQDDIEQILDNFCQKGLTLFMITHDLNKALAKCSRVISLKNGKLFFDGQVQKLLDERYLDLIYDKKFKIIFENERFFVI